ncbi:DNA cytosine methyltransferase, partial [Paracoccus sp. (in: a-proteobacteria)]
MNRTFKTIDLFAGPGGLAEGFSSLRSKDGSRVFEIALSVEKEPSAFSTLRLRAFVRQFETPPDAYYRYIAGKISRSDLICQYPAEWAAAEHETAMLELGTGDAQAALDPRLDKIRREASHGTVVIGGPPCQAYSLVGRARNRGIEGYDPAGDHRHFLYREYIRILRLLEPVAFVMENVKGILSSKVGGEGIFDRVLCDLRSAGGSSDSYTLLPLVSSSDKG